MAFLDSIIFLTSSTIKAPSGLWEILLLKVFDFITNYGWRIVIFTLCLKLLVSPLDIFQRYKARKNQKITQRLKPEMDRLAKQYPDRAELSRKQMELTKKSGISYASSCLPGLVTMVLFITLLSGLNNISYYTNFKDYYDLYTEYNVSISESAEQGINGDEAIKIAQERVYDKYQETKVSFLWIKNIWSPDVPWRGEVNDESEFKKNIGKYGSNANKSGLSEAQLADMKSQYSTVMAKLLEEENNHSNGYLVLPILCIVLSFVNQFIVQHQQKQTGQINPNVGMAGSMKMMMWIMPIIIGYFSLQYTSAFALYLVVQYLFSLMITLVSLLINKYLDKKEIDKTKNDEGIIRYGRPDPNDLSR